MVKTRDVSFAGKNGPGVRVLNMRKQIKDKQPLSKLNSYKQIVFVTRIPSSSAFPINDSPAVFDFLLRIKKDGCVQSETTKKQRLPKSLSPKNCTTGFVVLRAYVGNYLSCSIHQKVLTRQLKGLWNSMSESEKKNWNQIAEVYRLEHINLERKGSFTAWLQKYIEAQNK